MRVVGLRIVDEHCASYPDCRNWLVNWIADARASSWTSFHDVRERYASASFLAPNGVIFNVKGNKYRLVARIAYKTGVVLIEWLGTHGEYDRKYP
jgi:mRNA interferase HigB